MATPSSQASSKREARRRAGRFHNARIVIVSAQFHPSIAQALERGAMQTLMRLGVPRPNIRLVTVPGSFELVVASAQVARAAQPDAIVALGCLIRGQTPQYQIIGQAVANGLVQLSVQTGIPVGFGLILAETEDQAKARAGGAVGNRGIEAAESALAMLALGREAAGFNSRSD